MKFPTTPIAALCAALFLVFAATAASAAPKEPPAKPAPAPAPGPATATPGRASAGTPAPAPRADPDPSAAPTPAVGATASAGTGDKDAAAKDETRIRVSGDHSLTSILVPISFFLCILLLVGTIQYMGLRKDRNKHQTLQLMVEKGAQIPLELITVQKRRGSDLRRGLVLVGAGLGITLFLLMTKDARNSGAFGLGLVPALIGAGYLLAWKLEGQKSEEPPPPMATYPRGDDIAAPHRSAPTDDETTE